MKHLQPTKEKSRINSIDLIRGIAVLGILAINIVGMGLPDPAYFDPSSYGGSTGWNLRIFIINSVFFEGAMRGLFSLLFGAGIILFMRKKEKAGAGIELAETWYKRLILLIIFGMIHAYLMVWPGDILFSYGMIALLLFPFRNSRPRNLIIVAIGILLIGVFIKIADANTAQRQQKKYFETVEAFNMGGKAPYADQMDYYAWIEKYAIMKPTVESHANRIMNMKNGYFSAVKEMAKDSYFFESEYNYRHNYFDILSMMLLGMALLRLKILQGNRSVKFYGIIMLIGYAIGIPLNLWETQTYIDSGFNLITYYQLLSTYDLGRISIMFGHIGLIMLFFKSNILMFLQKALIATGRMALSNYLIQTIIANIIFIGFAQYGNFQRYELTYIVIAIWIFQLTLSTIWLKHFNFGPFEWLWRSLTYGKLQSFKK